MRKIKRTLLATAVFIGISGVGHAGFADGNSYTFQVWSGSYTDLGITGNATDGPADMPVGPVSAQFNYTGPINFVNTAGQNSANSAGKFFGSNSSGISNFFSLTGQFSGLNDFLNNDTLSNIGLSGSALVTYMMITGTYTAPTGATVTISHDDGASLYVGVGNTPVITSGKPTADTLSAAMLPEATSQLFQLVYVEANGAPSVLQLKETLPVPEPGSLALLGTGLVTLGLILSRRRSA